MSDAARGVRGGLLHFECAAGVAGDMAVGALVDLGVPESVVQGALATLGVGGYRVEFARVKRGGMMGGKFRVLVEEHAHEHAHGHEHGHEHEHAHAHEHAHEHEHEHGHGGHAHRHYSEIRRLIDGAALPAGTQARALAIFDRLAEVEARIHGVAIGDVVFHEVGAIDSIVDVVAAAAALDWLAPARVTCGPVALGHGTVKTAHGLLPVPAPATLALLVGAPVVDGGCAFELTTPTGAAILAASVDAWGALPSMEVVGAGWGAGDRELADRPNLVRVIAGRAAADAEAGARCVVVEANLDDTTPELVAPIIGELLAAGARDAWVTPLLMKKGRPGWMISALCDGERVAAVEQALFRGSSTIGVRRHAVERTVLPRRLVDVETPFGVVRVKVSGAGEAETAAPEHEDCARVAAARGVPVRRVHAEAIAAWYRRR